MSKLITYNINELDSVSCSASEDDNIL